MEKNLEAVGELDPTRSAMGYEYLDHTADVQIHSWGPTLKEAFEQCAKAMFGYMTDLDTVEECSSVVVTSTGHDLQSALYNFMNEWLFVFSADPFFVPFKIEITEFTRPKSESDSEGEISITSRGFGETFRLGKHPQGTEVKAITYSAMQINEKENFAEIFLIIDI